MATSTSPSSLPKTYQEQQQELCLLSQFIRDKEEWLESVLKKLEWSREQCVSKVKAKKILYIILEFLTSNQCCVCVCVCVCVFVC